MATTPEDAPITRSMLTAELRGLEERIEERMDVRLEKLEERMLERIEKVETNLLRAFRN